MNATSQKAGFAAFPTLPFWVVAKRIWPRNTRKLLAIAANVPTRTARDWVEGRSSPRAEKVLEIAFRDPAAATAFRAILDDLDIQRSAIRAGLARLETTHSAVARAAVDRSERMGARASRGMPAGAAGVVKG